MAEKKAQYAPSASQVDLEQRQKNGNASDRVLSTAPGVEHKQDELPAGYVGIDPQYATAANKTEAPIVTSKGPEAKIFEEFTGVAQVEAEDENEDEAPAKPEIKTGTSAASTK